MPPARNTIADWTEGQLAKYVRDAIQQLAPDHLTSLTVDDLIVAGTLTAKGTVTYSTRTLFYVVGASGQPAYTNSWVNGGAPYFAAAYIKTEDGWVRMRGAIKSGVIGSSAFTLPPGFRPASTSRHAIVSNAAFGIVDITSAGLVVPQSPSSNVLVSLDGIQFKAS